MNEDNPPPAAPTPTGNQNLIIGLVLGAVVLLLFLLILQMNGGGFGSSSAKNDKVDDLKRQIEERRNALNQERAALGLNPLTGSGASGQSAGALASRIRTDSTSLAGLVGQMQTLLGQREEELSSTRTLYNAASREMESLRKQVDAATLAANNAQNLQAQLNSTQALLDEANSRAAAYQQQLAGAPDASAMEALRRNLDEAIKLRDSFQRQVQTLEDRLKGMVGSDQLAALNTQVEDLKTKLAKVEPENTKLRYELQKLRSELDRTRLFVEKVDDLPAAAKALYIELSKLETATPAELKREYERIDTELKTRVVDTVSFQTGSSRINLDKVEEIRRAMQSASDESFFLIVGYASKSGDLASNRKLSADRATTIASVANFQKKDNQGVQAVFLSQTDRFSPTELARNQICEIWEIRK